MRQDDSTISKLTRRTVLSGVAVAGGVAGLSSVLSNSVGTAQAQQVTGRAPAAIAASPATSGVESVYTITVRNVQARDGQSSVDQIALDFRGTGMNFNTVAREDITLVRNPESDATPLVVTKTRTSLTEDRPTIGVSRASGQPRITEGDTIQVRISGVVNPVEPGEYIVGVQLNELATGQRAGTLDSRTGQFTITGETGALAGTIESDGVPVTGEVVLADGDLVLGVVTPDTGGEFTLEGIPPETYDVTATGLGIDDTTELGVEVAADETTAVALDIVVDEVSLAIDEVTAPDVVEAGDAITAEMTVTNEGIADGPGEVLLEVVETDGEIVDAVAETVALATAESTELAATFDTADLPPTEYAVRVTTEEDVQGAFLAVVPEMGVVALEILALEDPLVEDTVRVPVAVTNGGEETQTRHVELVVDEESIESRTAVVAPDAETVVSFEVGTTELPADEVTFQAQTGAAVDTLQTAGPGETRTVSLPWQTDGVSPGAYDVAVVTPTDTATASVTVSRPRC